MRKGIIKKEVENKGIKESDEEKNVFKKLNAVGESRIMRTKTAFGSGTQELMVQQNIGHRIQISPKYDGNKNKKETFLLSNLKAAPYLNDFQRIIRGRGGEKMVA